MNSPYSSFGIFAMLAVLTSCSGQPTAVRPPDIDAEDAAAAFIAQCDTDGDGRISPVEAESCPGVHGKFEQVDSDTDGWITREEAANRFATWTSEGVGVMRVGCLVTINGKPLSGATVTFEPESFVADELQPAVGVTNEHGQCSLSVDPADLPASQQRVRGVQPGVYRVKIMHGTVDIPAQYNTATTLGQEVSAAALGPEGVRFDLSSR